MTRAAYDPRAYWTALHHSFHGRLEAVGYSGFGEGFNRMAYALRRSAVRRLLRRNRVSFPSSVLEAGVGVGAYGPLWARLGVVRWVGLDISELAVDHCRSLYPQYEFVSADITATSEPGEQLGRFDLVTGIDILYHLTDDAAFQAAMKNLAARVRPGGWLLVSDVFPPLDRSIAPHVQRRALISYRRALGAEMSFVDREPVFSILGDPVPFSAKDAVGYALLAAWKLLARLLLATPAPLRSVVGAGVVLCARPLDALLRLTGASQGRNLELALFRKTEVA